MSDEHQPDEKPESQDPSNQEIPDIPPAPEMPDISDMPEMPEMPQTPDDEDSQETSDEEKTSGEEALERFNQSKKKLTALVVEDSRLIRANLVNLLKTRGVEITEAEDGVEALAMIRKHGVEHFSMILLDMLMPRMDGMEFLKESRKRHGDKLPPVFGCSSIADRKVIVSLRPMGITGYILKPFKSDLVFQKLAMVFPQLRD